MDGVGCGRALCSDLQLPARPPRGVAEEQTHLSEVQLSWGPLSLVGREISPGTSKGAFDSGG